MKYVDIHPEAELGENISIGSFTTIGADVKIGAGTELGSNVTILPGTRIGENCIVHPGAVLGNVPQDLKFNGEYSTAVIGNDTVIRECVTINRGTTENGITKVGDNCLLMAYVHIAHDCLVGDHVIFSNSAQVAGHVEIDDYVICSGNSAIHQFCKIGKHAFIGGAALVRKDVPPFVMAAREPISYCGLNYTGLKRRNFKPEEVNEIHEIYRLLFNSTGTIGKTVELIKEEVPDSVNRKEILDFIARSERGLIKGY